VAIEIIGMAGTKEAASTPAGTEATAARPA
jgi:hypothetical protein